MADILCKKCGIAFPDAFTFCPSCGRSLKPQSKTSLRRRPKGTGSVFKMSGRRSKPWVAKLNGKLLGYFETRPDAEKFLADNRAQSVELINYTLENIHDRWQTTQRFKRLSKDTKSNYSAVWKRFGAFKNKKMREIKSADFQAVINAVTTEGLARDTCEKIRNLASVLCQEAMKDDIIDRNYALTLELPQKEVKFKRRNFTDEEIITLFEHDDERNVQMILCLLYSGMRESELFSIRSENVNLDEQYMIGGIKTEAGKDRVIPIRTEILPYVKAFISEGREYLITSSKGGKVDRSNFLKRIFYPTLDKVGINYKDSNGNNVLTPHRTRHTFIAGNIEGGAAPEALTKVVGHSKLATTVDKYADNFSIDYLRKEAQKGL